MKTKALPRKLTRPSEYRTPKSINMERTFEFYGNQRMSLGEGPVRTTAGQLTAAMLREAGERIKSRKDSE